MLAMNTLFTGMGEALWDLFPHGKQIGGAPANFAFHANRLGFDAVAVSAVGNDAAGDEIIETFDRKQLKHLLARVDFPTGTVEVELDAQGIPRYDIRRNAAWDNIPQSEALDRLAAHTQVFCFGTLAQRHTVSRATIRRFLEHMPDGEGRLKVFDANLRQRFYDRATVADSIKRCNILKVNDEELPVIASMLDIGDLPPEQICRKIRDRYGLHSLILTCGALCSHIFTPAEHSQLPTPEVAVADTVGAGDSFTASYCAATVAGQNVHEAHRLAVDISAWVCTQHGAMPEIPDSLRNRLRRS